MFKKAILLICFIVLTIQVVAQEEEDVEMDYDTLSFAWIVNGQVGWPAAKKPVFNVEDAMFNLKSVAILLKYEGDYPELKKNMHEIPSKGNFIVELKGCYPGQLPDANKIKGTISYWKKAEEPEEGPVPPDDGNDEEGWEDPEPRNTKADFEKPVCNETPEPPQKPEDMSGYANKGEKDEIPADLQIFDSKKDIFGRVRRLIIITNMNFPEWNQIGLNYDKDVLELHVGM
jgi:hypothetical protein